ncbi:3-ketoacyl-CoA thiolase B [Pyrenophora tritici-repentis]|nr:3-ketoacyl-CoA thiolase B [Pyrenophora tritici-repentis]
MANQAPNKVQERLTQVEGHLTGAASKTGKNALLEKKADDIVITCALRTAFTKGGKGGFKDTHASDLLHGAYKALV